MYKVLSAMFSMITANNRNLILLDACGFVLKDGCLLLLRKSQPIKQAASIYHLLDDGISSENSALAVQSTNNLHLDFHKNPSQQTTNDHWTIGTILQITVLLLRVQWHNRGTGQEMLHCSHWHVFLSRRPYKSRVPRLGSSHLDESSTQG